MRSTCLLRHITLTFHISDVGNVGIEVPFLGTSLPSTSVDWNFTSTMQLGAGLRQLHYTLGKVLGGSSCLSTSAELCRARRVRSHLFDASFRPSHMEHLRVRFVESLGIAHWRRRLVLGEHPTILPEGKSCVHGP